MKGITSIEYRDDLGRTPALVNRNTGEMYISKKHWDTIPFHERMFILAHEWGHVARQSSSEHDADSFAFEVLSTNGYPLSKTITALSKNLSMTSPEHSDRILNQIFRASQYDVEKNQNTKAKKILEMLNITNSNYPQDVFQDQIYTDIQNSRNAFSPCDGNQSSFLGICFTKACAERKHAEKMIKLQNKGEFNPKYQQQMSVQSVAQSQASQTDSLSRSASTDGNNTLYIVAGVVAVVVLIGLVYAFKK